MNWTPDCDTSHVCFACREVLDILLGDQRYVEMGAHPVRGVLLEGPPGAQRPTARLAPPLCCL